MDICVILLCLATQSLPTPQLVQTRLALNLAIDYDTRTISGTATITVRNIGTTPVHEVPLQIGRLMTVSATRDGHGEPVTFSQDVVQYRDWPSLQINQIYVAVDTLDPDRQTTVVVEYQGQLVGYTETGMRYVRDHIDRQFTILRTDAWAFPQIGVPSLRAFRELPREEFIFQANITVPTGLTVVTPVPEYDRQVIDEYQTWSFNGTTPVPFLNITVAPYELLEQRGVRIFYFPQDSVGARNILRHVRRATSLYSTWFGTPNTDLQLTVSEIPEGWGSQASLTGGIIQTADAFRRGDRIDQLYHELAHLWHPMETDLPASRWNEGLANFLSDRATSELDGRGPLNDLIAERASAWFERLTESAQRTVPMAEYGRYNLTDWSYSTGRLMFYVLFETIGETEFDEVLGEYFRTFRPSGSTTREFTDFVSERTPAATNVFSDWLYSVRWLELLGSGQTMIDLIQGYRGNGLKN